MQIFVEGVERKFQSRAVMVVPSSHYVGLPSTKGGPFLRLSGRFEPGGQFFHGQSTD